MKFLSRSVILLTFVAVSVIQVKASPRRRSHYSDSFEVYDLRNLEQVQSQTGFESFINKKEIQPIFLVAVKNRSDKYSNGNNKPTDLLSEEQEKSQESIDHQRSWVEFNKDWNKTRRPSRPNHAEHEDNKKESIYTRKPLKPWSSWGGVNLNNNNDKPSFVESALGGIQNDQEDDDYEEINYGDQDKEEEDEEGGDEDYDGFFDY